MARIFYKVTSTIFLLLLLGGCAASQSASEDSCKVTPPSEPIACPANWDPVCGCDGKTYSNACSAGGAGVSSHTPGECGQKLD